MKVRKGSDRGPVVQRRTSPREGVRLQPPSYGIHHADSPGVQLPAPVRHKMEHALGTDFSGVRVHEGPLAPRIGAQAFTRGTDIHFAPGQYRPHSSAGQRTLGHELAHVVQQSQGRARPTTQVGGVAIDASPQLEHEADRVGDRAARGEPSGMVGSPTRVAPAIGPAQAVVQRTIDAASFKGFLDQQVALQNQVKGNPAAHAYLYTTVGFEHEFGQMTDGPLLGLDHLEISRSNEPTLEMTELPFVLETDAGNAIELVSPPFLMATRSSGFGSWKSSRKPIPKAEDVEKVDQLIRADLLAATSEERSMTDMAKQLDQRAGIEFPIAQVDVEEHQLSPAGKIAYQNTELSKRISKATVEGINVKASTKGGGITTQVNFATDAKTSAAMQDAAIEDAELAPSRQSPLTSALVDIEADVRQVVLAKAGRGASANYKIFLAAFARMLSGVVAVPHMALFHARQHAAFGANETMGDELDLLIAEGVASHVKDTSSVWVKDSALDIGLGLLSRAEWLAVRALANSADFIDEVNAKAKVIIYGSNQKDAIGAAIAAACARTVVVIDGILADTSARTSANAFKAHVADKHIAPAERGNFAEHDADFIGPRQDTWIGSEKTAAGLPGMWDRRLHVVETRADFAKALELLKKIGGDHD